MAHRTSDDVYLDALNVQIRDHWSGIQEANQIARIWFETRPIYQIGDPEMFWNAYPPERVAALVGIPYPGEDRDYPSLWDCVVEAVLVGLDHAREEREPDEVFTPELW